METTELKVGDVVKLKSGGPPMTIHLITNDKRFATCVWFAPNGEGGWTGPYDKTFQIEHLRVF